MMNISLTEDTLKVASKVQNVSVIERLVDTLSAAYKLNDEIYGKLLLTVVEGVSNAIIHGNNCDESKEVTIHFVVEADTITFEITDMGPGFNPDILPDPTAPENIELTCGRGIYLMKHLSDEIKFEDGGRKVIVKFSMK